MAEVPNGDTDRLPPPPTGAQYPIDIETRSKRGIVFSGYLMVMGALMLFGLFAWKIFREKGPADTEPGPNLSTFIFQHFGDDLLIIFSAIFLTIAGMRLLGKGGKGVLNIIPENDRQLLGPLIQEGKKEAIDQYIRLSALGGFTGTFQKIGFTGLPLATAILTLIFSALSFKEPDFLELAKLTLGAFIGSFVQKGTDIVTSLQENRSAGTDPEGQIRQTDPDTKRKQGESN
jgi:hypothetical protein